MIAAPRAEVVHSMPGRLRLRFARREAEPRTVESLLDRLRRQPGIRGARFNAASGSIVVEYDPAALPQAVLLDSLPVTSPDPAEPIAGAADPPAADSLRRCWWEANAALARLSGGRADLRLLVPLALALLAVRGLIRQGEMGSAPWHALLWYSYNVFYHFYGDALRQPPGDLAVG
jgi:cation-transporting P-type ATPase C